MYRKVIPVASFLREQKQTQLFTLLEKIQCHSFIHSLLFIASHVKLRKMEIQLFHYFGHITKSVKKFVFVILEQVKLKNFDRT